MAEASFKRVYPRKARELVIRALKAEKVPFLRASPGVGKSSIAKSIAKEFELELVDVRLSMIDVTDFTGLPYFKDGFAHFAPFQELFPVRGMELPKGKKGWLLFLDEFNSAPRAIQAASYKLILDRMVGQQYLHDNVFVMCAGNLATDRAITTELSTAMQSRLLHIEMEPNFKEWLEDIAIPQGYDSRIIAFLNENPSSLMDFRPDHDEHTFNCPRTWEFMNDLIKDIPVTKEDAALYAGTITSGSALGFIAFCELTEHMISIAQILADPSGSTVPSDSSLKWAIISSMMEKVTVDNFEKLSIYANRFGLDFKVLFYRYIILRHPELRHEKPFTDALTTLSTYLYG